MGYPKRIFPMISRFFLQIVTSHTSHVRDQVVIRGKRVDPAWLASNRRKEADRCDPSPRSTHSTTQFQNSVFPRCGFTVALHKRKKRFQGLALIQNSSFKNLIRPKNKEYVSDWPWWLELWKSKLWNSLKTKGPTKRQEFFYPFRSPSPLFYHFPLESRLGLPGPIQSLGRWRCRRSMAEERCSSPPDV